MQVEDRIKRRVPQRRHAIAIASSHQSVDEVVGNFILNLEVAEIVLLQCQQNLATNASVMSKVSGLVQVKSDTSCCVLTD